MPINLSGAGFYRKIRLVGDLKQNHLKTSTYILKVDFKHAVPVKYFSTISYDFEAGT